MRAAYCKSYFVICLQRFFVFLNSAGDKLYFLLKPPISCGITFVNWNFHKDIAWSRRVHLSENYHFRFQISLILKSFRIIEYIHILYVSKRNNYYSKGFAICSVSESPQYVHIYIWCSFIEMIWLNKCRGGPAAECKNKLLTILLTSCNMLQAKGVRGGGVVPAAEHAKPPWKEPEDV